MTGVAQVTDVDVVRFTSIDAFPLLAECVGSPPYDPVTLAVPWELPLKVTEQLAVPPLPLSVQLVGDTLPMLAVKLTLPVGVIAVPLDVSVTVALQVLVLPSAIGLAQLNVVEVVRALTMIDALPVLFACEESPA